MICIFEILYSFFAATSQPFDVLCWRTARSLLSSTLHAVTKRCGGNLFGWKCRSEWEKERQEEAVCIRSIISAIGSGMSLFWNAWDRVKCRVTHSNSSRNGSTMHVSEACEASKVLFTEGTLEIFIEGRSLREGDSRGEAWNSLRTDDRHDLRWRCLASRIVSPMPS